MLTQQIRKRFATLVQIFSHSSSYNKSISMFKGWLKGTQEKLEKKSFSAFYHYLVDNHECVSNYKLENFVMHRKKIIYNFISIKVFFVKITTVSTVL